MKKAKIFSLLLVVLVSLLILSACNINDFFKKKIVNEIENRYIEYNNNISVNNIEDALVNASEIAKSSSVGVRMVASGIITSKTDTGSGVIISRKELGENGYQYYVVTNRHVIYTKNSIKEVEVYLGSDRGFVDANIVMYDRSIDIALLSFISPYLLNVAKIANDAPKEGSFAIAVGSPYNLQAYYNTVTVGSISSSNRYYIEEDINGKKVTNEYIQHCAPINSGNSGGGLYNIYGELIGINTWKIVGELSDNVEGLCFAIPSKFIVEKFAKYL